MRLKSLSGRLLALWLMLVASAIATGILLTAFFRQSASAQVDQAEVLVRRSCADIADRYAFFSAGATAEAEPASASQMRDVVEKALAPASGVEGGIWSATGGSLAYAFPTYEGTGPKLDLPSAEQPSIEDTNARADRSGKPEVLRRQSTSQVLVLVACPLPGLRGVTAWTMSRVFTGSGGAYERLLIGLTILAATVLGSALWLGTIIVQWSRSIRRIETQLSDPESDELQMLSPVGEREFDRLIHAVNAANLRSIDAQRASAADQRLAAVGLLAAGVAHEIRNPIAAMRLKTENALANGDPDRARAALEANVNQIDRIDRIVRDLLTMTEPPKPTKGQVDPAAFLTKVRDELQLQAERAGVTIETRVDVSGSQRPCFDEEQLRRAVSNLVVNAIQHTPRGGSIVCTMRRTGERLLFEVADSGPGVPDHLSGRIFEPFVTGRPEGTGLGLSIVRETGRAHGGDARLRATGSGACFEIDIPWQSHAS